jgi:prevent-host-death family protein
MKTIGIFEAKTHLSEIIKSGIEVCLTNRGKEIAVIVPFKKYQQNKAKADIHTTEVTPSKQAECEAKWNEKAKTMRLTQDALATAKAEFMLYCSPFTIPLY